ncbi:MAG: YggT family protein [Coriobacteriaceae bacterium]|nr:YggT family protein [Coriobacteriaceae bacterium]MDD6769018.1 YggT family protein [Coriobacteriaceae bacterium]
MGIMLYNVFMAAVDFYVGLIIIYILMSWLPSMPGIVGDLYQVLGRLCDPFLDIFRRIIPPIGGSGMAIDFSPVVAVLVLQIAARFIGRFLLYL